MKEIKNYLKQYLLQEAKIKRLKEMLEANKKAIYKEEIKNAEALRDEIENKIRCIDDTIYSELLYQKYVLGKTLEEISFNLNYSVRQIERLHKKALEKINL